MRRVIHFFGILSIITTMGLWISACSPSAQALKPTAPKVFVSPGLEPRSDHWFDKQVSKWSRELKDIPAPANAPGGNCMPFVVEMQKRIVGTGRMAIIVVVDPVPSGKAKHAMLMYGNEKGGKFNKLIDNGQLTKFHPKNSQGLYERKYGEYIGICKEPFGGMCYVDEPF